MNGSNFAIYMLRRQLSRRDVTTTFSTLVSRGFSARAPSMADWKANNDILFNATAAMRSNSKANSHGVGKKISSRLRQATSNHSANQNKKHPKKPGNFTIKWSTGTDRAKEAANSTVSAIFQMNCEGNVKVIDSENKMKETRIHEYARGIDLNLVGLSIVDVDQIDENTKIPLIKLVETKVALKRYSDKLAKHKERELINMGIIKQKNSKSAESDDSSVKRIRISWEIKADDLSRQKAREIMTQLKKGLKVLVYIDSKNPKRSKKGLDTLGGFVPREIKLSERELQERTFVVDKITEIVGEYAAQPEFEGTLEDKIIIKLSPKLPADKKVDKKVLKEERKKERQEKLRRRIEKKKRLDSTL